MHQWDSNDFRATRWEQDVSLGGDGTLSPPHAAKRPVHSEVHGHVLIDDYAWLRAENWRDVVRAPKKLGAEIAAHLKQENAYSRQALKPLGGLRRRLFSEMRERIKEDDSSVPLADGPWLYYQRFRQGGEHPLICRRPRDGNDTSEVILLDGDECAAKSAYFDLTETAHSRDHRLLAWACDDKGSELSTIRVRDLSSQRDLADTIEETSGDVIWTADCTAFYYVKLDSELRPRQVYRHVLGTSAASDCLIHDEQDGGMFVSIDETQSGTFGLIEIHDQVTSEAHLIDLNDPNARPRLIAARQTNVSYSIEHCGDDLIIRTNHGNAEDFKLMTAPLADPGLHNWQELIAHREGCYILAHTALKDYLVRLEREDGLPRIVVRHWESGHEHKIDFAEEAYSLLYHPGFEFDTTTLRFIYSSLTTPAETFDYDLDTRQRVLRKRQEVPSGHDPAHYVTKRLQAPAHDGERVPVSLIMKAGTKLDGSSPVLLYGYGSYGHALGASFRASILSLVDRGMIYAIAHIRGGTEKGRGWYLNGKLKKKTNTFKDFISAGEALIANGYTAKGRIVAHGGSAGGMLMGAVVNMRPDLFAAIIAEVPFVDVINTMLDKTLPLTPAEWPEWGNPIEDAQAFRTMLAYSPYDNVSKQAYPKILAVGGLTDPRVTYWEPAKWVAKLREYTTSNAPILLDINMSAGHAGASGRLSSLKEICKAYAFALEAVGLSKKRVVRRAPSRPQG